MVFVLLFVVGMLIIPVMIDVRKHGHDNILRRSDRDILEFKMVASMVRIFPSLVARVSDVFPGALSLLLASVGLMFFGLTMAGIYRLAANTFGSMSMASIVVILLVGLIAGFLAGQIARGTGRELIADICFGIIGALIGGWLVPRLNILHFAGIVAQIMAAIVGAALFLIIFRLFHRAGRVS